MESDGLTRKKLVSPVKRTAYYRDVLFTAMRSRAYATSRPHMYVVIFEKADIIEKIIVESRIKAGSASFLCKSVDGAAAAHTSWTSFHYVDNVMVPGRSSRGVESLAILDPVLAAPSCCDLSIVPMTRKRR